jgi:hypothetical protein
MCGARALGVGYALAREVTIKKKKKTPPTVYFTYMGSRDPPADYYELWLTWCSRRRNQFFKFLP